MATSHVDTEKQIFLTLLLSVLTKCLFDSNKILIINIFVIKQWVNRKEISVIIFCVIEHLLIKKSNFLIKRSIIENFSSILCHSVKNES